MSGELPLELREHIQGEPGVASASEEPIELLTERFRKRLGTVSVPRAFLHHLMIGIDAACRSDPNSDLGVLSAQFGRG